MGEARRLRLAGAVLAAVLVAGSGVFLLLYANSHAPKTAPGHRHGGAGRSVTDLVDPSTGPADVHVDLVARKARITGPDGLPVQAWTFNGTVPGPQITVRAGQLVEIALHNVDVDDGVTVHWHGIDVPNAMDGVAGVTQDAVGPGGDFTYRFRPERAGTFWYHTHQDSAVGVGRGLFGAFVVLPAVSGGGGGAAADPGAGASVSPVPGPAAGPGPVDGAGPDPGAGGGGAAGRGAGGAAGPVPGPASGPGRVTAAGPGPVDGARPAPGDGASMALPGAEPGPLDLALVAHTWRIAGHEDAATIGGEPGTATRTVTPGTSVRLRLINTDSLPEHWAVAGTVFTVAAIDGTDVVAPTEVAGRTLVLGGGGRYDVTFTMPDHPVSVGLLDGNSPRQVLAPPGAGSVPTLAAGDPFDPLSYGTPAPVPFSMSDRYDVDEVQVLQTHRSRQGGRVVQYWTINGKRAPDVPMIMVAERDSVRVHVVNDSDTIHPMHLHGHRVLVLQRNGVPASGSPWWADTVNLDPGDDVWVAFRADNPGIWMDHCHNLDHAAAGMLMHVAYRGIGTPFSSGGRNRSE